MAPVITIEILREFQETMRQLEVRTKKYIGLPDYPTLLGDLQKMKEEFERLRQLYVENMKLAEEIEECFNYADINEMECIV